MKLLTVPNREKSEVTAVDMLYEIIKSINDYSKYMQVHYGISGPQLWVLWEIQNTSLTMSQIAENIHLHPSTVSGIINRLELKGWVKRVRTSKDHRVINVEATELGNKKLSQAPIPMRRRLINAVKELPQADVEKFAEILNIIVLACDETNNNN